MDKLLEMHLERLRIKGPLAEVLQKVCCMDVGPWVKPLRLREFYTSVEMERMLNLANHIARQRSFDGVGLFMIAEDINDIGRAVIYNVPRDQYQRMPYNYHIGLTSDTIEHGALNNYAEALKNTHMVPVGLFATIFGSALGRVDVYSANYTIFESLIAEMAELIDDRAFSGFEILKAVFIERNIKAFHPQSKERLGVNYIPNIDQLEHYATVYGKDLGVPELLFLQMLDAQRFYGDSKYVREDDGAVLFDNPNDVIYILDKFGVVKITAEEYGMNPEKRNQIEHYAVIPEKFLEAILVTDVNEVIHFFGGEVNLPDAPQSDDLQPGNFQLSENSLN